MIPLFCKKSVVFLWIILLYQFAFSPVWGKSRLNSENSGKYLIHVSKEKYRLYVIDLFTKKTLADYPVSLGINLGRKATHNDNKTPEGIYRIQEILSAANPKNSVSYQRLSKMNQIHWKAKDGHYKYGRPKEDLGRNAYGPRVIILSYPNQEDLAFLNELKHKGVVSKHSRAGSWIGIHGTNDPNSIGKGASSGCVRMLNEHIVQLDHYIQKGTTVRITP